ncbi:MAG: hypothetical protein WCV63_03745 [Negativicutes bacterium]
MDVLAVIDDEFQLLLSASYQIPNTRKRIVSEEVLGRFADNLLAKFFKTNVESQLILCEKNEIIAAAQHEADLIVAAVGAQILLDGDS